MALEPYYYRPATPPEASSFDHAGYDHLNGSAHSRNTSGSSLYSNDSSPDSVFTHTTTPSRSPIRQHGPTLLPKIRPQDQVVEPASAGGPVRTHRRAHSNTRNPSSYVPYSTSRPPMQRSTTEPADGNSLISPISTSSMFGSRCSSAMNSPVTLTVSHTRKSSGSHARSTSASSISSDVLRKFGFPTYTTLPTYVSQGSYAPSPVAFAPTYISPQPAQPVVDTPLLQIPQPEYDVLPAPAEPQYSYSPPASVTPTPETTLLAYLTRPTQTIDMVRRTTIPTGKGMHTYFWWDIRNLRSWSNFSLRGLSRVPNLLTLLNFAVPLSRCPSVSYSTAKPLVPETESELADLLVSVYAPKINAALVISQGENHMSLYRAPPTGTSSPDFLANYQHDSEQTAHGTRRGRVVGVVKSCEKWHTGMRSDSPVQRVKYLAGLSHLHKCMRDHHCRYGFIMNEIELVCVRVGCDNGDDVPYFGKLEISTSIPISASANPSEVEAEGEAAVGQMTVGLALYYLLMLAKAEPLPGQPGGFMDVGGPGALTRQRVWHGEDLPEKERGKDGKDKWIPEPGIQEKRNAKHVRGWVLPSDPWHKREGGGVRRLNR